MFLNYVYVCVLMRVHVCILAHTHSCHGMYVDIKGQLEESVLSCRREDPGDRTQESRLGSMCLYLLSYLACLEFVLFFRQ